MVKKPVDDSTVEEVTAVEEDAVEDEAVLAVEEETAPILESMPQTPGEIRDAAIKLKNRAQAIGAKPLFEGVGEIAGRFFGKVHNFFDDVEEKKK